MAVNPAGFQPVFDYGAPQIIGGMARDTIAAGDFVFASGTSGVVSSGANSFATTDLLFATAASGLQFAGIAVQGASSGAPVSVATGGVHIVRAYGTVTAGTTVVCEGTHAVATATTAGHLIGRALTEGASGGYCLVQLK